MIETQSIYCGDNIQKLRDLPSDSVDLVYADPPTYGGIESWTASQGHYSEQTVAPRVISPYDHVNWIRPRIIELHRILKGTGSLYYHCETKVDSYIRVMLDEVFGMRQFRSQIIWRRNTSFRLLDRGLRNNHDSIFLYTKSGDYTYNQQFTSTDQTGISAGFENIEPETGRRFRLENLTVPYKNRPKMEYEVMGVSRVWRYSQDRMEEMIANGRIVQPRPGTVPRLKVYLEEYQGDPIDDIWTDIPALGGANREFLGYPTQKPTALLNRIINMSSNEADIVLDAFVGSGTALCAAQSLGRQWIGFDISPTACRLAATRLKQSFNMQQNRDFHLYDIPKTAEELREYPPYEFENWAVNAVNMVLAHGRGTMQHDQANLIGLGGLAYPADTKMGNADGNVLGVDEQFYPVQVRQFTDYKKEIGRDDILAFAASMKRQKRAIGYIVAFGFSQAAHIEIGRMMSDENLVIIPVTVQELLNVESKISP